MTDRLAPVKQLYEAFATGNGEMLGTLLADTDWQETGGMPYGGHYRGFEDIFANVFGPINNDIEGFTAIPDEIVPVADDRVLARGYYRGRGKGGDLETPFGHLWTVKDGKLTHFFQYCDTHLYRQALAD